MKRQSVALAGLCLLSAAAFAAEDELGFSVGLDLSYKTLKMGSVAGTYIEVIKTPIWSLGLSPTLSYGKLFAVVSADRSLGASNASTY